MTIIKGKGVVSGTGRGNAMVTKQPMNFTAAFTKPKNLIPGKLSYIMDRHHELYGKDVKGKVMVIPSCIGSTYTGMVLLELMYRGVAPAGIVVQAADPLLVSGPILADVWFKKGVPVVEYPGDDLWDKITPGATLEINGDSGEIKIS